MHKMRSFYPLSFLSSSLKRAETCGITRSGNKKPLFVVFRVRRILPRVRGARAPAPKTEGEFRRPAKAVNLNLNLVFPF